MRLFSLALQIKHLHLPAVLLLNMADEAPKFGVKIEPNRIAKHLGIPVLPISAKYGDGYDQAVKAIAHTLQQQQEAITAGSLAQCSACDSKIASEMSSLLEDAVYTPEQVEENLTTRLDRILLHPVFGLPLFFAAMFLMFQIVYALGTPVQNGLLV
ncbi:FeoB small GTPase domain-containing protein [Dolichospermum circinale]|uniref:FeoB small GTPase domain-containing protein n=1 Tax=Dolichospermum circinale TaxID=109265 RepID=UPI00232DE18E|nr:FeoB small GTPase domain-containing protein [Dolichospermum circinale]MDB9451829.1 FeoB small GTPase domain-containing protein [Dolichospermum circinale CS-547]